MGQYVEFNPDRILSKLNIFEKSHFNYAAKQSLKVVGFKVAKHYLPQQMGMHFEDPVPYTLRSVRYGVQDTTLTLSINPDEAKGNAPAKYLYGVMSKTGGAVYPTRFAKWLWDKNLAPRSTFPIPAFNSPAVPKKGRANRVPAWFYAQTQAALAKQLTQAGNLTVVGTGRKSVPLKGRVASSRVFNVRDNNAKGAKHLYAGIYRVKSSQKIDQLFRYADSLPTVPSKLPFHDTAFNYIKRELPDELMKQVQKSIAKTR